MLRSAFYGWRMVGVAFVVDFVAVGFWFYSLGVFLGPLARDLGGGSRAGIALGLTVSGSVGALLSPFVGRALDRVSIRRVMVAGSLLVSTGFALVSVATSRTQYYLILACFLGAGMTMMGGLASTKLVANWFEARRGTALGAATVGVSLSGLVMPSVATWLLLTLGWRGGFRVYAAATLAVILPLVLRVVVDRPEDLGLRPDGGAAPEPSDPPPAPERVWRAREVLASRNFWAIAFAFGLSLASLSAVLVHFVPYATDLGVDGYRAALVLSLSAGAGAVGKVVFGRLVDRFDPRVPVWLCFGGQLAGLLLLMRGGGFLDLAAGGLVFGLGMGGVIPLQGAVVGAAFGRLSFGSVLGMMRPVQVPLHMLGAPLAGLVYDRTGSYALAFRLFLGAYVAAGAIVAALRVAPPGLRAAAALGRSAPETARTASDRETGLA